MPEKTSRIAWVDFAKGIAIILVVLGHASQDDLQKFIFVFHMPFFFVTAGFLLNLNKWGGEENFKNFAVKLVKRLLLPYCLAEFLWYPIWFVVCHEMGWLEYLWNWTWADPLRSFLVIFIGNANGTGLILGQLWFLPCLLVAEIIFIKLYNRLNKIGAEVFVLTLAACSLSGLFIGMLHALPLGTDIAFVAQIFLLIGVLIRRYDFIGRMNLNFSCGMMLVVVVAFYFNVFVDMNARNFGNPFLFYSGAVAGILLVMKFSSLMTEGKIFSLISDCGRQSMMILILHPVIANIFYEIIAATTNFPSENFFTEPIIIFGATASSVLLPLFIAKRFGKFPVLKYFCP